MILDNINRENFRKLKLSCFKCRTYEKIRTFGKKKVLQCECSYTVIPPYIVDERQFEKFYQRINSQKKFKVVATKEGFDLTEVLPGDLIESKDKVVILKMPGISAQGGY